jgi:hypothetical protein
MGIPSEPLGDPRGVGPEPLIPRLKIPICLNLITKFIGVEFESQ